MTNYHHTLNQPGAVPHQIELFLLNWGSGADLIILDERASIARRRFYLSVILAGEFEGKLMCKSNLVKGMVRKSFLHFWEGQ